MHTTPRLALQIPDGTEAEDNFPAEDAASLAILDNAGLWQYGTLAAKPSASSTIPGTQYYCTDTFALLLCVGGQWVWPQASTEQVGTIKAFAGSTIGADPDGVQRWHICDGSTVSRTANATYYAQVGTTWGAGDGSTTVNLPDLRGRSIIGAGAGAGLTSRALASNGGAETALADLQSHTHTANVSDPGHVHNMAMDFGSQGTGDGRTVKIGLQDDPTYESIVMAAAATGVTVSNSPTGSGGGHANMQPFAAANHVVKIQ